MQIPKKLVLALTVAAVAVALVVFARPYVPQLDNLLITYVDWRVAWLITFVENNVYGVVMGVVTTVGVALKMVDSVKKAAADKIASVQGTADNMQSALTGQLSVLEQQKDAVVAKAEGVQEQLNVTNFSYQQQSVELLAANSKVAELQAQLNLINSQLGDVA